MSCATCTLYMLYMYTTVYTCIYNVQNLIYSLLILNEVVIPSLLCTLPLRPSQYVYAQPDQGAVVEGIFVPWCLNCSQGAVEQGLGIVGAVIMPHNLYLHSGLVLVSGAHVQCTMNTVTTVMWCHSETCSVHVHV